MTATLRREITVERPKPPPSRGELLERYRHLRAISKMLHSEAMEFLSEDAILHQARRLGLASGKTLILDTMDELSLVFDRAIYTAPAGRSRVIDRCARSAKFPQAPTRRSCSRRCAMRASRS